MCSFVLFDGTKIRSSGEPAQGGRQLYESRRDFPDGERGTEGFDIGELEYAFAVPDHKVPAGIPPRIRQGNVIGYRSFPYGKSGTVFWNRP